MNPGPATAALPCRTGLYDRTERKIDGLTEAINRSATPAEKIRNARELRDCVAVLLDCIDFDEDNPNCHLCRETATLRDGIASVIEKAGALAR